MSGEAGAARSAVNLALGLHGLCEAFSLSFVLDEEACNGQVGFMWLFTLRVFAPSIACVLFCDLRRGMLLETYRAARCRVVSFVRSSLRVSPIT